MRFGWQILAPSMASKWAVFMFFLTVFNLQSKHLGSYNICIYLATKTRSLPWSDLLWLSYIAIVFSITLYQALNLQCQAWARVTKKKRTSSVYRRARWGRRVLIIIFEKYFYKALISAFSANSAVNFYEKTDTNKTIHISGRVFSIISIRHISSRPNQCNNFIILVP